MSSFDRSNTGPSFQKNSSVYSIFFGTRSKLLEDELNELQWNQIENIAALNRSKNSSGALQPFNVVTTTTNNIFYLQSSPVLSLLVDGYLLKAGYNSVTGQPISSSDDKLFVLLNAADATSRTDLVMLEAWFEVINFSETFTKYGGDTTPTLPNNFFDARANAETSRRVQFKWRLRAINGQSSPTGVTALKPDGTDSGVAYSLLDGSAYSANIGTQYDVNSNLLSPGIVYAIPLVTVARKPNVNTIAAGDITTAVQTTNMTTANLTVTGNSTIQGNSTISGNETVTGNLTVNSIANMNSDANVAGNLTVTKTANLNGDAIIGGNLTVKGTTTYLNTSQLQVSDNIITLNDQATGTPTLNAGIEVDRGSSPKVSLLWMESLGRWQVTFDGTNFYNIVVPSDNVASATKLATARKISLSGDTTGSATFDGSGDITITTTLANVATAGTYPKVTINAKGLVTGGSNLSSSDVTTGLGYTPVNNAGDTLSGDLALSVTSGEKHFKFTGTNVNWGMYGNTNGMGLWDWQNGRNVLSYNVSGNTLKTLNSTLDDGSGNMIAAGNIGWGGNSSYGAFSASALKTDQGGSIELGSVGTTAVTPYIDFHTGVGANDYDARIIASGGTSGTTGKGILQLLAASVKTSKNILDDSNGNMSLAGTITGVNNFSGQGPSAFLQFTNASGSVSFANPAGTILMRLDNAGKVTTIENTLDDGSGNMTLGGTLTVNGANISVKNGGWMSGKDTSGTIHGMLQIDGGNKVLLNQDSGMGGIWTSIGGVAKNQLDDGSGNMTVGGWLSVHGYQAMFGTINLEPQGAATSTSSYQSNILALGTSTWNGSAAVTNWRNINVDANNNLQFTNTGYSNVFTIDNAGKGTFAGGLFSKNNTLDDGSGNMTVAGGVNIQSQGTATSTTDYWSQWLRFQSSHWNGTAAVTNTAYIQLSNGNSIEFTDGTSNNLIINQSTHALTSYKNTLDDGNGNVTLAGSITINGTGMSAKLDNNDLIFNRNGPSYITNGTAGGLLLFRVNGNTTNALALNADNSMHSLNNTIDDGTGNMITAGNITMSNGKSLTFGSAGTAQNGAINFGNGTGTSALTQIGNGSSVSVSGVTGDLFGIAQSGVNWLLALDHTGTLGVANGLKTKNNTLDDGSGNMTVTGGVTISGTNSNGNGYIVPASGKLVGIVNNAQNAWGLRVQDGVNPSTYTNKNTLDDGNGNMTVAGNLTASVLYNRPYATATSSSGNQGAAGIQFQNSTWNGTAAVTNYRNFYMDPNGTIVFTGYGGQPTVATIDNAGKGSFSGGLVSKNNTLDDGSGNMTVAGNIQASGKYLASEGTGSAGGYSFTNDAGYDTGMFSDKDGDINFYANNVLVSAFNSSSMTVYKPFYSAKNTLDDGSGNMTVNGGLTANLGATNSVALTLTSSGAGWGSGIRLTNTTASTGKQWGIYSGAEGNLHFPDPSGNDTLIFMPGNKINTYKNTLDDGSGNITVNGSLTVNQDGQSNASAGNLVLKHPSSGGYSSIVFESTANAGSDYAFIKYQDTTTVYDTWGSSAENSTLIIGVQNDGQNNNSDSLVLQPAAGLFVDFGMGTTSNAGGMYIGSSKSGSWATSASIDMSGNATFTGTVTAPTFSGNATTATKMASAMTLSFSGDVSGSVSFDGSANASTTLTAAVASTSQKGIVMLNSATNSTDETTAATPKAVNVAATNAYNNAKSYTDTSIANVNSAGVPSLAQYQYVLSPSAAGQLTYTIPLTGFNASTDATLLSLNRTLLDTNDYSISGTTITLNVDPSEVSATSTMFLQIFKNVPIGSNPPFNGAYISNGTVAFSALTQAAQDTINGKADSTSVTQSQANSEILYWMGI